MKLRLLVTLLLLLAARPAAPLPIDAAFAGSFTHDDEVALFGFSITGLSPVTLVSHGYAGGRNAAGQAVPRGGFDPVLAVFDAAGLLVAENDDGGADVPADALTGATFDSFLLLNLAAGDYTIALSVFDNTAIGPTFADGFSRTGQSGFTAGFGCPDAVPAFNDVSGLAGCGRTGAWAFDVQEVETAVMPEPASVFPLALGALAYRRRIGRHR